MKKYLMAYLILWNIFIGLILFNNFVGNVWFGWGLGDIFIDIAIFTSAIILNIINVKTIRNKEVFTLKNIYGFYASLIMVVIIDEMITKFNVF